MTARLCATIAVMLAAAALPGGDAASAQERRYGGFVCTLDCTSHDAGFRWAKSRGVLRAHECIAAGRSFNQGCLTYVRLRGRNAGLDDAGRPIGGGATRGTADGR